MAYTYEMTEVLKEYNGVMYRMNEIKIISGDGMFRHRTLEINVIVTNGTISVHSFMAIISGNQKELLAYFTTDAFSGYSGMVSIKFGYGNQYLFSFSNVNIQQFAPLPSFLAGVPHQDADSVWLQTII